ncbi:hypothetical protein AXF42_Ash011730 [Apostasia shenzhenica]|uniref:DUF1677 domain-containing protein n=1 Tax=Apostasia shenzhenica TaxID=1088818 RepID=A0A2H9ZUV6_9ASPA|nr:hypothetical protein AXF42_Ash011730 [Apostasia shenzhenica]
MGEGTVARSSEFSSIDQDLSEISIPSSIHSKAIGLEFAEASTAELGMMAVSAAETKTPAAAQVEVEFAKCECCGLTEECTPAYIARVRERHHGRWICGLCAEAVEDEIRRADCSISAEEALDRHMTFSRDFRYRSAAQLPVDSAEHLIAAMRQLLRRSLDSPRSLRSAPASLRRMSAEDGAAGVPRSSLTRSGSCFSTIAG